jgi:GWxTD domain-containing protein
LFFIQAIAVQASFGFSIAFQAARLINPYLSFNAFSSRSKLLTYTVPVNTHSRIMPDPDLEPATASIPTSDYTHSSSPGYAAGLLMGAGKLPNRHLFILPGFIVAVFLTIFVGHDAIGKTDTSLRGWYEGPVRYIMEPGERKAFRALESDRSRALFVEKFWIRRDPSPETLTNEYRQIFWQRVQEANNLIHDSPKPGWMTDRGKIYILYGPPTEIKEYVDLDPQSSATSGRGVIRWIYEGRPGGRIDMDPITVVPFNRDFSGEYHVSYDPKLSSVFFDELAIREGRTQRWDKYFQQIGGSSGDSTLSVMLDLGKMQEVPSQAGMLITRVTETESFETHEVIVQIDQFRHPDKDSSTTSISLRLPGESIEEPPALMARLSSEENSEENLILGEDSFRLKQSDDGTLIAQARIVLPSGKWDMIVIAANSRSLSTGVHEESFSVSKQSDSFSLSDVILATELEPVTVRALASYDEPFLVGTFRVIPMIGKALYPGGHLALLYEIYEGKAPYQVSYQLQGQEDDGRWVSLGRPAMVQDAQAVQGWDLPLGDSWPTGAYRIQLEVHDAEGLKLEREVPFTLEAPPAD